VEDPCTAAANMHRKLVKFGCVVFELCERTDRQTDTLITIVGTPRVGGIMALIGQRMASVDV